MIGREDRDARVAAWLRADAPGPIDDTLLDRIGKSARTIRQRRSGWARLEAVAVPMAAAAAILGLIVAIATLAPRPASEPPPADALLSSPTASPTPSASTGTDPPAMAWSIEALPDPRPEDGQGENPYDVVAGGPGFVAVGRSHPQRDGPHDESRWTAAIWTSVNGETWDLVPDLEALGPAELHAVAAGPDGRLLAVGFDKRGLGPEEEPPSGVGMWTSPDGIRWQAGVAPDGQDSFIDVLGTSDGWLVAGSPSTGGPAIFSSTDLESWSEVRLPGGDEDEIDGLFGHPDGRALAFGCDHPVDDGSVAGDFFGCARPTGWIRTSDGWEAVDLPVLVIDGAVLGDRYVVVGAGEDGTAAWSSLDGRSWKDEAALPGAFVETVAVTSEGVVAGGTTQVGEEAFLPAVWRSADGVFWQAAELLPVVGSPLEPTVTAVIETPIGVTALGYAFEAWPVAYAWTFR